MKKIIEYIISVPKSLWFCLNVFPLNRAVKLPILVRYNVVVKNYGNIEVGGGVNLGKLESDLEMSVYLIKVNKEQSGMFQGVLLF